MIKLIENFLHLFDKFNKTVKPDSSRSSETLLDTIINELPDVFVLKDENGDFVLCNQTVAKLYNTTPEQMVGKCDGDFGVPKEMSDGFRENVLSIMKSGETQIVYEDSVDAKTGEIHHFRSIKKPIVDVDGKNKIIVIAQNITEIVRANQKIAENEKRLKEVLEITQEGIWDWNIKTGEVKHNEQWYSIFGFEENDLTNRINLFMDQIYPDDKEIVMERLRRVLDGEAKMYISEHRMVRKNGEIMWVQDRGKVVEFDDSNAPLRMVGSFSDITHRKKAESESLRLSQVVDQNPYPTFITDTDGIIQYVNASCVEESGYAQAELLGHNMKIFQSGEHSKQFYTKMWTTIKKEKSIWKGMLIDKMKNGELRDWESTIFPLFDENKKIMNFVSIKEDLTERNLKDKLFIAQTRQAQMGEMLSIIAHQWRQPLAIINAIVANIRLHELLEDEEDHELVQQVNKIEEQSLHLSNTITDFKDFFRPDKAKEAKPLSAIISNALNLVDHSIKSHGVTVNITVKRDCVVTTYVNEVLQVLITLIKNSLDAFEESEISKRVITIIVDHNHNFGTITISDNAGGIEESVIDKIFLPYYTTKEKKNGTGLGLYMSKMVIEEHCSGTISVKSDHVTGTTFIISLPLREIVSDI